MPKSYMPSAAYMNCHASLTPCPLHADTDLDDSGDEDITQPFSLDAQRQAVIAEPWGITSTPDPSGSPHPPSCPVSPSHSPHGHTSSTTQWQAHWLALRIHALRQQQQRYERRLQKLQLQQNPHAAALQSLPAPLNPQAEVSFHAAHQQAHASLPDGHQQAAGSLPVAHQQPSAPAASATVAQSLAAPQQAQPQPLAMHESEATAGASLVPEQTQVDQLLAPAVHEPRNKHRHARHPVPGLSMPEIARHAFFCQYSAAGCSNTTEQPASQGELVYNKVVLWLRRST